MTDTLPGASTALHSDAAVWASIHREEERQEAQLELIASENHASEEVMAAMGTALTNKYAEGYPGRRYYGGCEHVDEVEDLARDRAKELFGSERANVQPHSGTQANMAAFMAVLDPGDKVLAMSLDHGGHLSHGHVKNFSGVFYEFHSYGVDRETERVDMDEVRDQALQLRPRMLLAGASAYSRPLDFEAFAAIAREIDALFMVDMAHIAGLVAGGAHASPVPHADIVTIMVKTADAGSYCSAMNVRLLMGVSILPAVWSHHPYRDRWTASRPLRLRFGRNSDPRMGPARMMITGGLICNMMGSQHDVTSCSTSDAT